MEFTFQGIESPNPRLALFSMQCGAQILELTSYNAMRAKMSN